MFLHNLSACDYSTSDGQSFLDGFQNCFNRGRSSSRIGSGMDMGESEIEQRYHKGQLSLRGCKNRMWIT